MPREANQTPRSHPVIQGRLDIRHGATHAIVAHGLYGVMRRLYWLDTWMMRMAPETSAQRHADISQSFIEMRQAMLAKQQEVIAQLDEAGLRQDAWQDRDVIEHANLELRSPLATLLFEAIKELDYLLCQLAVLHDAEAITKQQMQTEVRIWRRTVWDCIKPIQAELDAYREEVDPKRASRHHQG